MYRHLFYTTVCLLFSSNIAQAASQTKQPPHPSEQLWTGFYAGINAGYAWGSSKTTFSTPVSYTAYENGYFTPPEAPQINGIGVFRLHSNGVTGGIQIGYNQRFSNDILLGLETDFGAFTLTQNQSVSATYVDVPLASFTIYQKIRTNWLYTLRPRLGYTFTKTLLFATGGLSLTDLNYTETFTDNIYATLDTSPGANASQSASKTKAVVGWNAGAGVEYLIKKNLSISLSYLYTDFYNVTLSGLLTVYQNGLYPIAPINGKATLNANIIRLGMNWHF